MPAFYDLGRTRNETIHDRWTSGNGFK